MARVIKTVYELITRLTGTGLEQANAAAKVGESAFKRFSEAVKFTHSAFEVASKLAKVFEKTIGATIGKAIEYRGANDAAVQSMTAFRDKLDESAARAGDALIPALAGVSEVLGKLATKSNEWMTANRALVQGGVIEWAVKLAVALASGVAVGVETVIKAWSGWVMLISTTEAAYEKMQAAATKNNADERRAQGFKEEADRLDKLVAKHERLGQEADGAAAKAMTAMTARLSATQGFYDSVIDQINAAGEAATQHVGDSAEFVSDKVRKLAGEARSVANQVEALLQRLGAEELAQQSAEAERIEAKRVLIAKYNEERYTAAEKLHDLQKKEDDKAREDGEKKDKAAHAEWKRRTEEKTEELKIAREASISLFQGIAQGFVDAALDGKDFADSMISLIRRVAEELLAAAITSGIGSLIGGLFGFAIAGPGGAAAGAQLGGGIGGSVAASSSGLRASTPATSSGSSGLRSLSVRIEGPRTLLPLGQAEQQRMWRRQAEFLRQMSRNR